MSPNLKHISWLLGISALFFFGLGSVHLFDWDEINFAECAREMIVSGDYASVKIGFKAFWEKPPLFIWMQAFSMMIFGINEYAARFPNALFGALTLVVVYLIGSKVKSQRYGFIAALLFAGSLLPHFYARFGIIDPVFNLFILLSVWFCFLMHEQKKLIYAAAMGFACALAVLTKGPVAILLLGLTVLVVWIFRRFRNIPGILCWITAVVVAAIPIASWFAINIYNNGWDLFWQFINYQIELFSQPVAGHEQPFWYHFVVVLLGCFPMSFFALPAFRRRLSIGIEQDWLKWMKMLFWVVIILFSIVTTKIIHYSSMTYLPLAFLAASVVEQWQWRNVDISKALRIAMWTMIALVSLVLILLPVVGQNLTALALIIKGDAIEMAEMQVPWPFYTALPGLIFLSGGVLLMRFIRRREMVRALLIQSVALGMVMFSVWLLVLPRIERYTQGPVIDFLMSHRYDKVYVAPLGMKSYAHYFYGNYSPEFPTYADDTNYLLTHPIDRPVYLFSRKRYKEGLSNPAITVINEQGAYRFFLKTDRSFGGN